MVHKSLQDEPNIRVLGRNIGKRSEFLTLFHAASGVELDIAASELWMEFISDYSVLEPWISIEINGCRICRQMIDKGTHRICIFRGMNPDVKKHVRVFRDIQAMNDDEDCLLQIGYIEHDGFIFPLPEKKHRIEFIGDSISSGEGVIGAKCEEDWVSMLFCASAAFTVKTADYMDADFRVVSQSGWGVLSSWDNNPYKVIPHYYEQVCGMTGGARNRELGAQELYSFDEWKPDAVVINLGTNDESAFHQPEWVDAQTGERFKQRLDDDGSYNCEDIERFIEAAAAFLVTVRKNNPSAEIVWAYGMLGCSFLPYITEAVKRYAEESGDLKVSFFKLPDTTEKTVGARQHPGEASHMNAALELSEYLKSRLGEG